jgi:hypothetical protein
MHVYNCVLLNHNGSREHNNKLIRIYFIHLKVGDSMYSIVVRKCEEHVIAVK